jgi:nicotinamide phosphoribosyltransferase
MENNIILMSDSYKTSHWNLLPQKTEKLFSYLESRGGKYDKTVFFGLQYFIKRYLVGQVVTLEKINEAQEMIDSHIGPGVFNRDGWLHILNEYGGRLPVEIKAVPEGTIVPTGNVLLTIQNTDDKCFWLVNYLETLLLQVWYSITVATQSYHMKQSIKYYLKKTSDDFENAGLEFKLHDFGMRGVSSLETSGLGGLSHLTSFMGTDTMSALSFAKKYYDCDCGGFSIPASEHSTITSWGRENEVKAFENMLDQYESNPVIACVSDSFNIYEACEKLWGTELKDKIMNKNGTLVIRPDSGDPLKVIPKMLDILYSKFGGHVNKKGYKVLDSHVRIIQGDGINSQSMVDILREIKFRGWSTENITFGSGGALLQMMNRDTQKFAFKACAIKIDGKWADVYKDPIEGGFKASKKGRLALIKNSETNIYETVKLENIGDNENILETVFIDGELVRKTTLDEVRETIKSF